ncbi:MAG: hypothetical protein Sylvanvirus19_8 [Sylvanvirus sp.]|uniref:Macro domain-containing protein n=1 Tax=Sylvanvirus sp. TaxID=2487774 RepID=A0A3G5AII8_9VIRU|nr:MAG: hypothetical protein Sylvanvirus19_8 [Sylvanvirus sp.]
MSTSNKVQILEGDVLTCSADAIVQQINCVTTKSHGLSALIASTFPYANIYAHRIPRKQRESLRSSEKGNTALHRSNPGDCIVCSDPEKKQRDVICITGQLAPGKPGYWCKAYHIDVKEDTAEKRQEYFKQGLDKLVIYMTSSMVTPYLKIAFPWQIGCGLAGGTWIRYQSMIEQFAKNLYEHEKTRDTQIYIIKLIN